LGAEGEFFGLDDAEDLVALGEGVVGGAVCGFVFFEAVRRENWGGGAGPAGGVELGVDSLFAYEPLGVVGTRGHKDSLQLIGGKPPEVLGYFSGLGRWVVDGGACGGTLY